MAKKGPKSKRPSMKDVADLAGVSRTTVSFVINKVPDANIPQETHDRVWQAVTELGYRPNAIARGLRAQRTHTIGFISDEIATTPFAGHMIQGAQDLAWANNNLLLLINTGGDQEIKKTAIDMLMDRRVDGIIYATMYHREAYPPEIIKQTPSVLLDCFATDRSLPSVVPDEVTGAYQATKHLLEKGHHRIGFINNEDAIPATFGRFKGYKKALADFEVQFDDNLVFVAKSGSFGGYDGTITLMDQPDPPTALFCFNDHTAMGAYDALQKLNLSIPDDVGVMGYDNHELIAGYLYPPLSTMQLPHYEMGRWAMNHLLELIQQHQQGTEPSANPIQHLMECPLIQRAST
jgi:LacI family transcriptional regulator